MTALWTCDICGRRILGKTGYVQIEALDGGYPVVVERRRPAPGALSAGNLLQRSGLKLGADIRLAVLHAACDPHPSDEPYQIPVERACTLTAWVAWADHLAGKPWMGGLEMRAFLEFWFTNRGQFDWRRAKQ